MSTPSTQRDHPGIWIRQNVLPSGMTVTDAAKRLGIGRPALSNLLNGRAALSQQMVQRLARTFGADAAALLELQARYDVGTTARERQPVAGTSFAPSVTTIRAAEIENWANRIEARQRLAVLSFRTAFVDGAARMIQQDLILLLRLLPRRLIQATPTITGALECQRDVLHGMVEQRIGVIQLRDCPQD